MRRAKKGFWVLISIAFIWFLLTLFVQQARKYYVSDMGSQQADYAAVVLFNPDPFYDLDERVARQFGTALAVMNWKTRILSVAALEQGEAAEGDLFVMIANTYNWAPDKPIQRTIKAGDLISGKPVAAITLGSGSTQRSQQVLETLIRSNGGELIGSEVYWLMRPNDESSTDGSNIDVAMDKVSAFAIEIAQAYENSYKNIEGDVE